MIASKRTTTSRPIDLAQRRATLFGSKMSSIDGLKRSGLGLRLCLCASRATGMQIRSRAYLQMISRLRTLRVWLSPSEDPTAREASPLLIYIVVVLVLLLAMLEIDLHKVELQAVGLTCVPNCPDFIGP